MLMNITCFRDLPTDTLSKLQRAGRPLEPHDGTLIFAQGDPANAVYAIIAGDGHVRIGSNDAHSKSLMAQLFGEGDLFGEIGVIDGGVRSAEAITIGRVKLWRIGAAAFLETLRTEPLLGMSLSRILAQRLRRTHELLQDATFAPLSARLARQLLYLADLEGRPTAEGTRIALRFRQADLADLLGATTRSVITILNDWRARGLVAYDVSRALLTIRDEHALRAVTEGEPTDAE